MSGWMHLVPENPEARLHVASRKPFIVSLWNVVATDVAKSLLATTVSSFRARALARQVLYHFVRQEVCHTKGR